MVKQVKHVTKGEQARKEMVNELKHVRKGEQSREEIVKDIKGEIINAGQCGRNGQSFFEGQNEKDDTEVNIKVVCFDV